MELGDTYSPEKKLTLVALRLAILEKVASEVGVLSFIWATVVLSRGFAIALECVDFCFVTAILLVEGARIFSRHQATCSPAEAGELSFRTGGSLEPPNLHPCSIRLFNSSSMSRLLYWLQLFSATACAVLSSMRLAQQNYGDMAGADKSTKRIMEAPNIIGVTEGMMREFARIFLDCERQDGQVREEVGDALAMLVVESGENCEKVRNAEEDVVAQLLKEAVKGLNSMVGLNAFRILTYLFAYGDPAPHFSTRMDLIIAVPPDGTEKQQETSTGFMVQVVKCMTKYEFFNKIFSEFPSRLPEPLVNILPNYKYPSITTPSITRNVIELSICLMQLNKKCITKFRNYGMKKELKHVAKTTSDVEYFVAFCGNVGIARYETAMTTLIDTARELLRKN